MQISILSNTIMNSYWPGFLSLVEIEIPVTPGPKTQKFFSATLPKKRSDDQGTFWMVLQYTESNFALFITQQNNLL